MQQAIEELEQGLKHLEKAREILPDGKPYDPEHYRQLLLHEAGDKMRYVLDMLKRDAKEKEE